MQNRDVGVKQVEYLYSNLVSALLAVLLITVVIFFTFEELVDSNNLAIWTTCSIVVVVLRLLLYAVYKKDKLNVSNVDKYYYLFFIGLLTSGLIWGATVLYIFPQEKEYQILLLLILGGLSSGSSVSTSSRIEMFYSYVFVIMGPFIYVFSQMDESINTIIAFFTTLYIFILFLLARKIATNVTENILLGFENIKLISQLQEKVLEANKSNESKSRFLSTMSHEIRTPMNAIIGFIHILKKMESESEKLKYLNTINNSSNLLLSILNDILDISKIESGKLSVEFTAFNPKEEFDHLYTLFKESCSEKNILLINSIDATLPLYIESDKLRLKQIITNLLSNALKFTAEGKSIEFIVKYTKESSLLYVEIKDEGIGIEDTSISKILEEFSQADSSTARKYGGTGLGLSIVSKLLELLSSKLEIQSEINIGSSFSFELHVKEVEADIKEVIKASSVLFSDKKVLVAEDNKTNQMLISLLLEDMDLDVKIAQDGVEAESMFLEENFDIVLMDINMPNKNGIEAMQGIRAYDTKSHMTPIIAVTANAVSGDKEKYLKEGFDDYLSKPIDNDELESILQKFLLA